MTIDAWFSDINFDLFTLKCLLNYLLTMVWYNYRQFNNKNSFFKVRRRNAMLLSQHFVKTFTRGAWQYPCKLSCRVFLGSSTIFITDTACFHIFSIGYTYITPLDTCSTTCCQPWGNPINIIYTPSSWIHNIYHLIRILKSTYANKFFFRLGINHLN